MQIRYGLKKHKNLP